MVLGMPTRTKRREALETLPTGLYDSFHRIIKRIRECPHAGQAELGMRVLMWLHCASRPLKLKELQHALAVEKGHTEFDSGNIPSQKFLLDSCLGLVVVDKETSTVRFMHYTLEEHFCEDTRAELLDGCNYIAETCLTYLNFGQLQQHCTSPHSLKLKMKEYMFLKYAALYWGNHVKQQCNDDLTDLVHMIVDHESECPPCPIQVLYFLLRQSLFEFPCQQPIAKKFSGTHVIAYFGLSEYMSCFCQRGRYMGLRDESGRTPLSWASEHGHEAIVRVLLERGDVNVNAEDKDRWTPLLFAAMNGHADVVRLLIERDDININPEVEGGITPLFTAAMHGHEAVVRLLIERDDVDINAMNNNGWTLLYTAAVWGHEGVVQLLIERKDIDINAKGEGGWTPLLIAAANEHEAVVQLLVERDEIDVNAKNKRGCTPLTRAAEAGNEAIVRLLMKRDEVDVNARNRDGTPLSLAAKKGHEAVVRLLINRSDIDINAEIDGWTPLSIAAASGHEAVVRLLVENGSDINATNEDGLTALSVAAEGGYEAIVRFLSGQHDMRVENSDVAPTGSFVGDAVAGEV